ncbi:uncharacterized protein ATNIH1004_001789 [Aspergillus tanneri]|nr:uncharacterized protein ATNIH1004_001789 [Aspergillus tanneri]KAA8652880.1 hypothetical protein ATNIH1004_001789 [Aspergillus tanneri]
MKLSIFTSETSVIKLFADSEIFDAIPESENISIVELSNETGCRQGLLEQSVNFLVTVDVFSVMSSRIGHTKNSMRYWTKSLTTSYEVPETMSHISGLLHRAVSKATERMLITRMYDFSWVVAAARSGGVGSKASLWISEVEGDRFSEHPPVKPAHPGS